MKRSKVFTMVAMVVLIAMTQTACFGTFIKEPVAQHQRGVIMHDGVSISSVVGAGRYRDSGISGFFAKMEVIDISALQLTWEDPDLWTKDKQPLFFKVTVTFHRTGDTELIQKLWESYRGVFTNTDVMRDMVNSRIAEAGKQVTVSRTLEGMLGISETEDGGRAGLQNEMFEFLAPELLEFGVVLVNVSINDIGVSEAYKERLEEKANSTIGVELARQETLLLQERLLQEKAQTEISLEIAERNNLVAEEQAKVLTASPEAFELAKLDAIARILGDGDLVFLPVGTDISLWFTENGAPSVLP